MNAYNGATLDYHMMYRLNLTFRSDVISDIGSYPISSIAVACHTITCHATSKQFLNTSGYRLFFILIFENGNYQWNQIDVILSRKFQHFVEFK